MSRIYATCRSCESLVYREPGKRHGDGQVDSDDHPVWLLYAAGGEYRRVKIDQLIARGEQIGIVDCGCATESAVR